MVSKKKSRKSTQQSKGRTAAHSEENGNAIQNIDSLLKSLEERNAAQTANHAPPGGENTELTRDSNENDLDMQWADLLQVDTGFKSSEIQRKGKTKSKKPQKSKSSSIEIEGDTQQAGKENDIEMQWADLLHTGTGVQHKGQSSGRSKMKKKPKRDTRTRTTQVPKQIELRGPEAAQKARRRTSGQNKVSIQEPAATIDDLLAEPSGTPSDDADDNAFLKKVKSLAVEKKKAQEARIARANKRTLAAMQNFAGQTEEQNKHIVGQVSKFIITRSSPLEKKVQSFESAMKKQKTENERCNTEYFQAAKKRLTDVDKFRNRMAKLSEKFQAKRKEITAQAERAVQESVQQLRAQVERRNEADLKLKKLAILLRRGSL